MQSQGHEAIRRGEPADPVVEGQSYREWRVRQAPCCQPGRYACFHLEGRTFEWRELFERFDGSRIVFLVAVYDWKQQCDKTEGPGEKFCSQTML